MALRPLASRQNFQKITCCHKPSIQTKRIIPRMLLSNISRREWFMSTLALVVSTRDFIFREDIANAFDFGMVAPEQTIAEAESGIRDHAKSLLQVKDLLDLESWGDAQKALRTSSASLKLDLYTIIQERPANERPQLRKLYSDLFNNVTKLDYAARDGDSPRVQQCYGNMVIALNDILSRIS